MSPSLLLKPQLLPDRLAAQLLRQQLGGHRRVAARVAHAQHFAPHDERPRRGCALKVATCALKIARVPADVDEVAQRARIRE